MLRTALDGSLQPGESRTATILVDQVKGEVRAPFVGTDVNMALNA